MHWFDLTAVVLILIYILRGFRRGALRSVLDLIRIACAYLGAYFLASPLGKILGARLDLSSFLAVVLGGVIVFCGISIFLWAILTYLERGRRRQTAGMRDAGHSALSSVVGGATGLAEGIMLIVLITWVYLAVSGTAFGDRLPKIDETRTVGFSRSMMARGAYLVLRGRMDNQDRARQMAALFSEPDRAPRKLQELSQEPSVVRLINSREFGDAFLSGDAERILNDDDFNTLLQDDSVMVQLRNLGFAHSHSGSLNTHDELAEQLAKIGGNVDGILHDLEFRSAVDELRNEGLLEPDKLDQLILDSRFLKIVDRIAAQIEK